ncbi:hypothetical protein [Mesorhizobium sp. M1E.F.Ca.ET.063.01.1.1]|uniref:hypothetical protein n=1 Tax=Mesorhizobium sp. M1E.F.Ca.ET.063.01.1.1 TaxID=2496750 RepID=UPI001AECA3F1|nr:hypothetical protein [Mesorhizobium sp. M1E.F.Ca.ET.063.01.1.1]
MAGVQAEMAVFTAHPTLFGIRPAESYGAVFEDRSGAYLQQASTGSQIIVADDRQGRIINKVRQIIAMPP